MTNHLEVINVLENPFNLTRLGKKGLTYSVYDLSNTNNKMTEIY